MLNALKLHIKKAAASPEEEQQRNRKVALVKLLAILIFFVLVIVFGSLAWFASNRQATATGMGVRAQGTPYRIETRSESGLYKAKYDLLHSDAMEWKISREHNFDSHISAKEENEETPALEPKDHGSLEFRVSPQSVDSLTVDCLFEIKAYVEQETEDDKGNTVTTLTELEDSTLSGFLSAHIMLFAGYDPQTGKYKDLIDNDNASLERLLKNQSYTKGEDTYTTIYWYWPEHLSDLTDSENTIYVPGEHQKVIDYIARNKDGFFKDCSDSAAKVKTDLTNLYAEYSNQIYNHYNLRYDNADLDIGNNISYVVLSMQVK